MTSEFMVKIPQDRIAVLIGPKGTIKRKIEELTGAKVEVDSNTGNVIISIDAEEIEDPITFWKARDIVKAIGRGFNPEKAFMLIRPDYVFELLRLRDFGLNTPNAIHEVKSRLIGRQGRVRKTIENLTKTYISIYGNTVGIIGDYKGVETAREAIIRLINGAKHGTVFRFLENRLQELKRSAQQLWVSRDKEEDVVSITDLDELERIIFEEEQNKTEKAK